MDRLEQGHSGAQKQSTESSFHRADRDSWDSESPVSPQWRASEEEESDEASTQKVILSDELTQVVASAFKKLLSTEDHRRLRMEFPCPGILEMRLDPIFKSASIPLEGCKDSGCRLSANTGANA